MEMLKVALLQFDLAWENPEANFIYLEQQLMFLSGSIDLVVLPEMFSTGFTMNPQRFALSEWQNGLSRMQQLSRQYRTAICGSLVWQEQEAYFNRFFLVSPHEPSQHYDKHHLFSLSKEPLRYTAGTHQIQFNYLGWTIRPIVCYDLRFPVWCRNTVTAPYDLLIVPANWPRVRALAWKTLLQARAIENQAYVLGVNRCGSDPDGNDYSGDTMAVDPAGILLGALAEQPEALVVELRKSELAEVRSKFPFLKDADPFLLPPKLNT